MYGAYHLMLIVMLQEGVRSLDPRLVDRSIAFSISYKDTFQSQRVTTNVHLLRVTLQGSYGGENTVRAGRDSFHFDASGTSLLDNFRLHRSVAPSTSSKIFLPTRHPKSHLSLPPSSVSYHNMLSSRLARSVSIKIVRHHLPLGCS